MQVRLDSSEARQPPSIDMFPSVTATDIFPFVQVRLDASEARVAELSSECATAHKDPLLFTHFLK